MTSKQEKICDIIFFAIMLLFPLVPVAIYGHSMGEGYAITLGAGILFILLVSNKAVKLFRCGKNDAKNKRR